MADTNENDTDALKMLADVKAMIARTRSTVVDRSSHFFLWGLLVIAACLWVYTSGRTDSGQGAWLPWAILMPLGAVTSCILIARDRRRSHVHTYAEHTYDGIWLATGLGAAVLVFGNLFFHYFPPEAIYVLVSVLAGVAVYASGHIMGLLSFRIGGVFWWCGAAAMMLLPVVYHPLIMAGAIIPGYLIPAVILKNHVRRTHRE